MSNRDFSSQVQIISAHTGHASVTIRSSHRTSCCPIPIGCSSTPVSVCHPPQPPLQPLPPRSCTPVHRNAPIIRSNRTACTRNIASPQRPTAAAAVRPTRRPPLACIARHVASVAPATPVTATASAATTTSTRTTRTTSTVWSVAHPSGIRC